MNPLRGITEAEVYRNAAAMIRVKGWYDGQKAESPGSTCIAIALGQAIHAADSAAFNIFYSKYNERLPRIHEVVGENLVAFNDSSTKEDVLAALERAANLATPTPQE